MDNIFFQNNKECYIQKYNDELHFQKTKINQNSQLNSFE